MLLAGRDRPIRILVDHHHDSRWRDARHGLHGGPLAVTICRRPLTLSVLRRYHVAIIDAATSARFAATELKAIERFVAEGGGLLLASSAPMFELMNDAPAGDLPANTVAARVGFRFLSPADCAGEVRHDRDFRLGYPPEAVEVADGAPEGFAAHPPGAATWAPITMPTGARTLLCHPETGEPLAGLAARGDGRVCVVGTGLRRFNLLAHLYPLLLWLAGDAAERPGADVPAELGPVPKLHSAGRLRLICDDAIAHQAPQIADIILHFDHFMRDLFGEAWKAPDRVEVLRACTTPDPWDHGDFVGVCAADWARAYNIAFSLTLLGLQHDYPGRLLITLFPEFTIIRHLAIRFVEHMGFADRARRLREIAQAQFDAADPRHGDVDLARIYWATQQWHPKGMWLLAELERRFGDDFLRRLFAIIPKRHEDEKLPAQFAWASDKMAHYLSLAAGEDLSGWLAEMGTTVHPLPPVAPGDAGFDEAMRGALVEGATHGPAARRMEALADLGALKAEDRERLPRRVRQLVQAYEQGAASDVRAGKALAKLAEGDGPEAALAALQLVSSGHPDGADRLAELAPMQDPRFRLMAGHTLRRLGRDLPELSLHGLTEGGRRIGALSVELRASLDIHPVIDGYEVANVISEALLANFPHSNLATQLYVYWVHTAPQWRRAGLSRLAFAAAMEHEEARRCSCFALNTGTRNNAHSMYVDFGFVDMGRSVSATKTLALGTPCAPPDGVGIRPMADADRESARRFLLGYHAGSFSTWVLPVPVLPEDTRVTLAEKEGALIGVAVGRIRGEGAAQVIDVAVDHDAGQRPEIGVALLARLHQLLAADGATRASVHLESATDPTGDIIARAGYSRRLSGGVSMFGIRDLRRLFEEIRPLYERRLADAQLSHWRGRVIIAGERLRAGLEIDRGEVVVIDAQARPIDIEVRADDATITRFVTGRETPLEGYLQRRSDISPQVNAPVMKLLEGLFPECPFIVRWDW